MTTARLGVSEAGGGRGSGPGARGAWWQSLGILLIVDVPQKYKAGSSGERVEDDGVDSLRVEEKARNAPRGEG